MTQILLDFISGLRYCLIIGGILLAIALVIMGAFAIGVWAILPIGTVAIWAVGHAHRRSGL